MPFGPDLGPGNKAGQADNTHAKLIGLLFYGDYEVAAARRARQENLRVVNSDFYDCSARTVWCWYADDIIISGNRFENTGSNLADLRVIVSCNNLFVSNNRFVGNYGNNAAATHIIIHRQAGPDSRMALLHGDF